MSVVVYTDGCCKGNPGPGAWAFAVYVDGEYKGHKKEAVEVTTNNAMELMAIKEALEWAARNNMIIDEIHSDSSYAIKSINEWMIGWWSKGWKTSSGQPVKNLELMKAIYKLRDKSKRFLHVKGHAGIEGNERADMLCNEAYIGSPWWGG